MKVAYFYAFLSAIFAALITIFAKIDKTGVSSHLETALRTSVVVILSWGLTFAAGAHTEVAKISARSWVFLVLSGLATGGSWLCYYKALQIGEASRVNTIDKFSVVLVIILAFLVLGETVTVKKAVGAVLLALGTLAMLLE